MQAQLAPLQPAECEGWGGSLRRDRADKFANRLRDRIQSVPSSASIELDGMPASSDASAVTARGSISSVAELSVKRMKNGKPARLKSLPRGGRRVMTLMSWPCALTGWLKGILTACILVSFCSGRQP